ncbi:PilZ domain-containing protein [Myxococcota bacterium]|nr:PilZ domain-containing protein [Myxococcota bacterium]
MDCTSEVLLIDNGELDNVQQILDDERISYKRLLGISNQDSDLQPSRLLICTPRCLSNPNLSKHAAKKEGTETSRLPIRIVMVEENSVTLRNQLREVGFDYLVRQPVHPEALRLLLLRSLYIGEERRQETRVPLGHEIQVRVGNLPRRATLVELSASACRLLTPYALEPGRRLRLALPMRDPGETLDVLGTVMRIRLEERMGVDGLYSTAIAIDASEGRARQRLKSMLEITVESPIHAISAPGSERTPIELTQSSRAPSEFDNRPDERRRNPRTTFTGRVAALGEPAMRVLVGRDLSTGGMKIDRHPGLTVGDRLHLMIYGEAGEDPVPIWATVSRDEGPGGGMGLSFDPLPTALSIFLESMVANLPTVESLGDGEAAAMGTVMSQILGE